MTKEQLRTLLERALSWPEQRQQQLAEIAIEIEAEMSDAPYWASDDELAAIDEGAAGEPATDSEVAAAFARLRRR